MKDVKNARGARRGGSPAACDSSSKFTPALCEQEASDVVPWDKGRLYLLTWPRSSFGSLSWCAWALRGRVLGSRGEACVPCCPFCEVTVRGLGKSVASLFGGCVYARGFPAMARVEGPLHRGGVTSSRGRHVDRRHALLSTVSVDSWAAERVPVSIPAMTALSSLTLAPAIAMASQRPEIAEVSAGSKRSDVIPQPRLLPTALSS